MAWKIPTLARVANGWSMNTDTMGVYGNYYLKRAIIAQAGLGANLPEDAIYPLNLGDADAKPLDGAQTYSIHFDKAAIPPVDAFWSITLYDNTTRGPLVTSQGAADLSSRKPDLAKNADGSVTIYFGPTKPTAANANWIKTVPDKGWFPYFRLYAPTVAYFDKSWQLNDIEVLK